MLKKILSSKTLKDVGVVLSGNLLSVLMGFAFVILTARKLGPSEFGIFSTVLAYSIFISAVSDLGISQSLVRFFHDDKDEMQQKILVSTGLISVIVSSIVISLIASLFYHFVLRFVWHHENHLYTVVLFLMNIVIAINTFILAYFQTRQKFIHRALIDNLFSILRIGFTLFVLMQSYFSVVVGLWIIVWAYAIAILVALVVSRHWISFKSINLAKIPNLLRFGGWLAAASIFSNLYGKLDVLMLAWLVSAYQTGLYSAASRFITIFPLVVSSLSSVVSPRFAQFQSELEAKVYLKKIMILVCLLSMGMLVLVLLGKFIILTAYSSDFNSAVPLFQLLVIAYIPLVLSVPAGNALVYFYKKPNVITWIAFVQLIGLAGLSITLIPRFGAYGVIGSIFVMNTLGMMIQYISIRKYLSI